MKILLGFVPWFIYFFIADYHPDLLSYGIIAGLVSLVILNSYELKKRFVLAIGTAVYFVILFFVAVIFHHEWFVKNTFILSNGVLAIIAWVSIAIRQPFTLQYAKEEVPEEFWGSPVFYKINYYLSLSWAVIFTLSMFVRIAELYIIAGPDWMFSTVNNIMTVIGVVMIFKFPNYYRQRGLVKLQQKTANSPFLSGNYKPVHDEVVVENLEVIGEIPEDLAGVYLRNGPNPAFAPISYTYPFDGDGMIHAVHLSKGQAHYKNKYVQTQGLTMEQRAGKALFGGVMHPLVQTDDKYYLPGEKKLEFKNGAFINIIPFGKHYLALFEGDSAYVLDHQLTTLGEWKPIGDKPLHVGPHPRYDADKAELWFVNYEYDQPLLNIYNFDKSAELKAQHKITLDHPTMVHDFVLTKDYIVIFLCPVIFDVNNAKNGGDVLQWRPELGVRILMLHRVTGEISSFNTEAFFVFHFANAYQADNQVVIDFVKHKHFDMFGESKAENKLSLSRMTIDLQSNEVLIKAGDDSAVVEFPRVAESLTGKPYRYVYALKKMNNDQFNCVTKYDLELGAQVDKCFGDDIEVGEAVFVPKKNAQREDDGYLLFFAYDKTIENSYLIILDASNISNEPLAKIKMPRRVPHGLHGNWVPAANT